MAEYVAASAALDRLRGLIFDETRARSALAALEQVSADSAGAWARGAVGTLELPSEAETDAARRDLARDSRLADAARGAMSGAVAEAASTGAARSAPVAHLLEALHEILFAEAVKVRARQLEHEAATARDVEELIAIAAAIEANPPPGAGVTAITSRIVPWIDGDRVRVPAQSAPQPDLVVKYTSFASRLVRDPAAALA
jgi:hypothetical protein